MKKTEKIIWTAAAVAGAVSLFYNLRPLPDNSPPAPKAGEYYCPPEMQAGADKLKPSSQTAEELKNYPRLIEKAPAPSEAWRLKEEAKAKLDAYNRQIREYNEYLEKYCASGPTR